MTTVTRIATVVTIVAIVTQKVMCVTIEQQNDPLYDRNMSQYHHSATISVNLHVFFTFEWNGVMY